MHKPPAFQFYPKDWLSDINVMTMTPTQRGGYIQLLCYMWLNEECCLPDQEEDLIALSNISSTDLKIVLKCFQKKNGKIFHKRLIKELKKQKDYSGAMKKNAEKRWGKTKKKDMPRQSHGNAAAMQKQCSSSSSSSSNKDKEKVYKKEKNSEKEKFLERVYLSLEEHSNLLSDFGEQRTQEEIEALNDYGGQFPDKFKKYKSHFSTIRTWIRREDKRREEIAATQVLRVGLQNKAREKPVKVFSAISKKK